VEAGKSPQLMRGPLGRLDVEPEPTEIRLRYVVIIGGLLIVAFTLRTAVTAFRSPIRHPWWWAFVCLLCAPETTLNLDTGKLSTNLLSVLLFGVGYGQALPSGPTIIQVGFPAGALLFLSRRRKLVRAARPMLAEDKLPS
jgi:hypothetical protein